MFKEKLEDEEEDVEWVEFERERFERDGVGVGDGEGEDSRELPRLGCAISLLLLSASAVVERVVGVSSLKERERDGNEFRSTTRANRTLSFSRLSWIIRNRLILLREGNSNKTTMVVAILAEKRKDGYFESFKPFPLSLCSSLNHPSNKPLFSSSDPPPNNFGDRASLMNYEILIELSGLAILSLVSLY